MIAFIVLILALLGLNLNLAFATLLAQPDWALALLLASLLAHRSNWTWVLPAAFVHDAVLHWTAMAMLPVLAALPLAMIYFDTHLGAGLPQRVVLMLLVAMLLLPLGWGLQACLLTICLCLPVWYLLTKQYAQTTA